MICLMVFETIRPSWAVWALWRDWAVWPDWTVRAVWAVCAPWHSGQSEQYGPVWPESQRVWPVWPIWAVWRVWPEGHKGPVEIKKH